MVEKLEAKCLRRELKNWYKLNNQKCERKIMIPNIVHISGNPNISDIIFVERANNVLIKWEYYKFLFSVLYVSETNNLRFESCDILNRFPNCFALIASKSCVNNFNVRDVYFYLLRPTTSTTGISGLSLQNGEKIFSQFLFENSTRSQTIVLPSGNFIFGLTGENRLFKISNLFSIIERRPITISSKYSLQSMTICQKSGYSYLVTALSNGSMKVFRIEDNDELIFISEYGRYFNLISIPKLKLLK